MIKSVQNRRNNTKLLKRRSRQSSQVAVKCVGLDKIVIAWLTSDIRQIRNWNRHCSGLTLRLFIRRPPRDKKIYFRNSGLNEYQKDVESTSCLSSYLSLRLFSTWHTHLCIAYLYCSLISHHHVYKQQRLQLLVLSATIFDVDWMQHSLSRIREMSISDFELQWNVNNYFWFRLRVYLRNKLHTSVAGDWIDFSVH
jgi:hypothetical protein